MAGFSVVVAMDSCRGIGKNGGLPWHLSGELKHFKELTTQTTFPSKQNAVIMGRKTWTSLPDKFRPLPQRVNIVLTRNVNLALPEGVRKYQDLEKALADCGKSQDIKDIEQIFVIGGGKIFEAALNHPQCTKLHVTHILQSFDCDTFFPAFEDSFSKQSVSEVYCENSVRYFYAEYLPK